MKVAFFYFSIFFMTAPDLFSQANTDCVRLSGDLLYAARTGENTIAFKDSLAAISSEQLTVQLDNDDKRKTFWLNVYNAFTQTGLSENPEWYNNRNKFYKRKFIKIAGKEFSLDLIEHGILRRSKVKLSLGYLNKLFPKSIEKKLRVAKLDYRVHFALNCGARSCPPIAFYKPGEINRQLELATNSYLKTEVLFIAEDHIVELPVIFSWFRGDFGGKKGILKILRQRNFLPSGVKPGIKWKKYNWALALRNFKDE